MCWGWNYATNGTAVKEIAESAGMFNRANQLGGIDRNG